MKQRKQLLCILTFLMLVATANAQSDSSSATKPQFKLSLNYNTGLNYYGRTDSLKSQGFFPLAELWFSPKLYVNAAPIFVNNTLQKFDYAGTVTTIGYQNVGTKWISGLYFLKPFYKASSELVQSALKAQSGGNLTFQNKIANINAGADVKFSDKVDYGATAGLDHIIRIQNSDKSVIVLDPAFYTYAGTQNFQRTYTKKNKPALPVLPSTNQQVTEQVSRFSVLAYEVTMPVIYVKNKVMLIATPSYILPQNLITVANRPDLSEKGQNMFYATLTAKYTF